MLATVWSRLHRLGILYDRRFDVPSASARHDALKLGYRSSHTLALEAVPAGARVLHIGSGDGALAAELVKKGCTVDGMDVEPRRAGHVLSRFFGWDETLEGLPGDLRGYDVILLDRLEWLAAPERFLDALRGHTASVGPRPRIVATTGNVAFGILRLQ